VAKHRFAQFELTEEMIRYGFVAASSLLVDVVTLHVMRRVLGLDYVLSVSLGYVVGLLWNYFWATRWAFAYRRLDDHRNEFLLFCSIAFFGYLGVLLFMMWFRVLNVPLVEARVLSALIVGGLAFTAKKLVLFTDYQPVIRVERWYQKASFGTRLHIAIRRITMPFGRLLHYVPTEAKRILDIGTGHGMLPLLLAKNRPDPKAEYYGWDVDADKIAVARQAAKLAGADITFQTKEPLKSKKWDVIMIVDVLYLLSEEQQRRLIEQAIGSLRPGGVLLVKTNARHPAWKYWLQWLQEFISLNVLRITAHVGNQPMVFLDMAKLAAELQKQGLETGIVRLDRGMLHPHQLLWVRSKIDI